MKAEDLTGRNFGRWTVIKRDFSKGNKNAYWICQCSCDNKTIKSVIRTSLINGKSTSCGCYKNEISSKRLKEYNNTNRKNIIGKKYGLLTVIELTENRTSNGQVLYKCRCDCGNYHYATSGNLNNGNVQSCGCSNSITASKIKNILQENNVEFKTEYTFKDLFSPDGKIKIRFDFAIFKNGKLSHLIEYDGETHYRFSNSGWNTEEHYQKLKRNDEIKNKYCNDNNIKLIRISYLEKNNINIKMLMGDD